MPRFTAKNGVTGETVSFDWDGAKPPTSDDVNRISDQQRQSRIAAKESAAKNSEQSFIEKVMTSPASEYAMKAANALGLNQPWHPLDALSQAGQGVKQLVTGEGTEANPRTAGVGKIIHGAMGAVGPPLTAAGYALAPVPMTAGMLSGNTASAVANKGVETLAPNTSPEVKDLISTGAGLVVGGLAGHGVSRAMRPTPAVTPEVIPPETGLARVPPPATPPPRTGVNYAYSDRGPFAPRQLPVGQFRDYGPAAPPSEPAPPAAPAPPPPEPSPVPSFQYGNRSTLEPARPQAQLPERGQPIEMPPAPIRMPAAGTAAMTPEMPTAIAPPPTIRALLPPVKPPAQPTPDLTSSTRPDPISPSEVSTVSSPEEASSPVPEKTTGAAQVAPVRSAAEQTPPAPVPVATPPITPAGPTTPPNPQLTPAIPPPPQAQGSGMSIAQAALARTKLPDVGKLQAQLEQARAENAKLKTVPPPTASQPAAAPQAAQPPEVAPPVPPPAQPSQPGPVAPPTDWRAIANAAMKKSNQPAEVAPQEAAKLEVHNKVLNFIKNRKDANMDQIARTTGAPVVDIRAALKSLQDRGLVTAKGGKFNYNKLPGEAIEVPPPESETPAASPPPTQGPQQALSPYRQNRMSELQEQIGRAEDEGDTDNADLMREHLQTEEQYASIEKGNNPEAKQALGNLDSLYGRINDLELKESEGKLSNDEETELGNLYGKANKFSTMLEQFLKSEHGQQGGEQEGPGRNFFERLRYRGQGEVPRDPSNFQTEFGSPNQVLARSGLPGAVEIGTKSPMNEVLKQKFIGTMLRRGAEIHKPLTRAQRIETSQILNRFQDPEQARGFSPQATDAAIKTRDLLDEIFNMFPKGVTRSGGDVGYLKGYFTHMQKEFDSNSAMSDFLHDVMQYHLGPWKAGMNIFRNKPVESMEPGNENLGDEGIGRPRSPFVEHRTGDDINFEQDVKKVFPAYVEASAKAIYDKPWLDKAQQYLAQIPEDAPHARALAKAYLRNIARYDSQAGLNQDWNSVTGQMMRMHARAVLGLSTRLLGLHVGRLANTVYPEIPDKYMAHGALEFAKHPVQAYQEAGRRGLLTANQRPSIYKKPMETYQSILNFGSMADFVPDAIGWHALNKMYQDQGHAPNEAGNMATNRMMDLSMRVTPARIAHLFTRGGPLRPITQYKQQVFKIAEQYTRAGNDIVKKQQYGRALKYLVGVGSTMYLTDKLKMHLFHLSPLKLTQFGFGAYDAVLNPNSGLIANFVKKVAAGDVGEALKEVGLYTTGLTNAVKEVQKPSIFDKEPQGGGDTEKLPGIEN